MKAIVTGGCGFIGFNLCKKMVRENHQILVIDDLSSGRESNVIEDVVPYRFEKIQTPGVLEVAVGEFKPDVIFHLAAIPRISRSVEDPVETTDANTMGTLAVLDSVRKFSPDTRVIISSSSSVYGGADQLPTPEDYPANPQSPYALQKHQADQWAKMYAKLYEIDVVSLRYFNVFGAHSYYGGAYSTVLSAWLYYLYVDQTIKPFLEGDGTQTRDFAYVDNVVNANILAATHDDPFCGELFNIAQGQSHSLLQVKNLLERISGKTLELEIRSPRIGDVKHTLADISKARNILNYRPTIDFEFQVEVMSEWYKNEYPQK